MAEPPKKRLHDLLNKQQQRMQELARVKAKTDLRVNIPLFDIRYHFADAEETAKITEILQNLPFKPSGRIDTAALSGKETAKPTCQGMAWICFLAGSESLLRLYVCGRIDDILHDMDAWNAVSPFLLLLGDDRRLIFVDDNGSFTEAEYSGRNISAES